MKMDGREVFQFAMHIMGDAAKQMLSAADLRILQAAARFLKLPMEKVFVNVDRYGNTLSASIPIAFCEAIEQERAKPSDRLVFVAFGAGLTWAATAICWGQR